MNAATYQHGVLTLPICSVVTGSFDESRSLHILERIRSEDYRANGVHHNNMRAFIILRLSGFR